MLIQKQGQARGPAPAGATGTRNIPGKERISNRKRIEKGPALLSDVFEQHLFYNHIQFVFFKGFLQVSGNIVKCEKIMHHFF